VQLATNCAAGMEAIPGSFTPFHDRVCRECLLGFSYKPFPGQVCVCVYVSVLGCLRVDWRSHRVVLRGARLRAQDGMCETVRTCQAGEDEAIAPLLTRQRVCAACPAGRFKDRAGQDTACVPWRVCGAGQEADPGVVPNATVDAVCRACLPGTFKAGPSASGACLPATVCASGTEERIAPTAFADRVCQACVVGATFKALAGHTTRCEPAAACAAGWEETAPATASTDRQCALCAVGQTFKAATGSGVCAAVTLVRLTGCICMPEWP
jgi:hypothetical protein